MSRELPRNPNTRPPYSDVNGELEYYLGNALECVGVRLTEEERADWKIHLAGLDRAVLRVRAVLDPETLTAAEWELANEDSFSLVVKLKGG